YGQIGGRQAAGQAAQLHRQEREPRRRVNRRLEAVPADKEDVGRRHSLLDQRLTHRQSRVDMAPGAGGGDGEGHAFPPCWLMLTSTPSAAIDMIRAVLPKLTKG